MAAELIINEPAIAPEMELARALYKENLDVIIVDDETYKTVKATWQQIRNGRLDWEKRVAGVLGEVKTTLDKWKYDANAVTDTLKLTENDLRAKMQMYDDEKKAAKEKEERERHERFIAKTTRLFEVGFAYNGVYYLAGTVIATPQQVEEYSEKEFESLLEKGKAEADLIKAALAEIANRQKEEDTREGAFEKIEPETFRSPFILPVPDDDLTLVFDEVPRQPAKETEYRDPSFLAGFDACRNIIIDMLENSAPMTRSELRQKIRDLQAYKSMPDMVKYE